MAENSMRKRIQSWLPILIGILIGILCGGIVLAVLIAFWKTTNNMSTTTMSLNVNIPLIVTTTTSTTSTSTTSSFTGRWNMTGVTVAGVTSLIGTASNLLNQPLCITMDSSNAIYVSDNTNHRVQKWYVNARNGATVAGQSNGVLGSALNFLNYPSGIAIGLNGILYVVDGGNSRVLSFMNGTLSGTIIAGQGGFGSANNQLSNPLGLTIDPITYTIYVADSGNHRVMEYQTGTVSGIVVAGGNGQGTANTQLSNPRGLYFDKLTNSLFIVNNRAHNVVRWILGSTTWTLVVGDRNGILGNTPSLLSYPTDVKLDSMNNIYVSDEGNHRIQFFLSGLVNGTTIAGVTSTPGSTSTLLNTPSALYVDNQRNIYVVDYSNARVQMFQYY